MLQFYIPEVVDIEQVMDEADGVQVKSRGQCILSDLKSESTLLGN